MPPCWPSRGPAPSSRPASTAISGTRCTARCCDQRPIPPVAVGTLTGNPSGSRTKGRSAGMTAAAPVLRKHGNAYGIFILVLTIFSLAIMVLLLLPVTPAERDLLTLYDNAVCVIFLIDFAVNLL